MIDYNAIPDEDLYGMCVRGDEGAWEYIYNYVLIICQWKKWNLRIEPKELAQQIVLHIIEKALKQIKRKSRFRNFVKKIAINKIKDSFRIKKIPVLSINGKIKTQNGEDMMLDTGDSKLTQEELLINLEIVTIIDHAVSKLPIQCQRVLQEYFKFKMGFYNDYKELSKVLKLKIPTISSTVTRCIKKLIKLKEIKELMSP